jgi:3-methyl-2-oxobutanoate hydroxymethyltransferase
VHQLGGFKVQAREEVAAGKLLQDARALEAAGAQMLVVECVPSAVGRQVSTTLDIPVIGIGAGSGCDGQVLVMHDMLGLGDGLPKFVEDFMAGAATVQRAFESFVLAVREGRFPGPEHEY